MILLFIYVAQNRSIKRRSNRNNGIDEIKTNVPQMCENKSDFLQRLENMDVTQNFGQLSKSNEVSLCALSPAHNYLYINCVCVCVYISPKVSILWHISVTTSLHSN